MAGPDDKKPGMIGQVLPFLLVAVLGAGAGFAGFKMVGVPLPKVPGSEKPAAAASAKPEAPASAGEKSADKSAAHGEQKGAAGDEAEKKARETALLEEQMRSRKLELTETNVVPLTPIIANIANPSTTWIRLEASVAIAKTATAKPADIAQSISPRILSYLKTLKITDLQSASGMEFITSDINEIARTASNGEVKSVFLTGFVVE